MLGAGLVDLLSGTADKGESCSCRSFYEDAVREDVEGGQAQKRGRHDEGGECTCAIQYCSTAQTSFEWRREDKRETPWCLGVGTQEHGRQLRAKAPVTRPGPRMGTGKGEAEWEKPLQPFPFPLGPRTSETVLGKRREGQGI